MKVMTYLNFGGNCAEAFHYYEQHLGAKISFLMNHGQAPGGPAGDPGWADKVLHARLEIGDTAISGADIPSPPFEPIRSSYLSLSVESSVEAERIFAALSDGGKVAMPLTETFFAHRFGMVRDQFGVLWMVLHEKPMA
jgi:PhnB protein